VDTGLLDRRPDPHDHRAIQIYLTERGHAVWRCILTSRRASAASLLAPLTLDDRVRLVELLAQALASVAAPASPQHAPGRPRAITRFVRWMRTLGGAGPRR